MVLCSKLEMKTEIVPSYLMAIGCGPRCMFYSWTIASDMGRLDQITDWPFPEMAFQHCDNEGQLTEAEDLSHALSAVIQEHRASPRTSFIPRKQGT
jgi:hypothetical protein